MTYTHQPIHLKRRSAFLHGSYSRPRPTRHPITSVTIAHRTGPLQSLMGRKILMLADVENLTVSARNLGYRCSYRTLSRMLRQQTHTCALHAFFSREIDDNRLVEYFRQREWTPHPRDIETVRTYHGMRREANSDNLLLFMAGVLISRSNADLIVVGSGDGKLVHDLSKALSTLPKPRQLVTLSLAGSTARRLDAHAHPHIADNIELGRDCLQPLPHQR